jgi:hypothetical protein
MSIKPGTPANDKVGFSCAMVAVAIAMVPAIDAAQRRLPIFEFI